MNRVTRPPSLPAWLLRTLGSGEAVDALLGDLTEEYQQGRSAAWFWWQAVTAIAVTFVSEVRAYPLLTMRAIVAGWILIRGVLAVSRGAMRYVEAAIDVYLPDHEPYRAAAYRIMDGVRVPEAETVPIWWNQAVYYPVAQLAMVTLAGLITGWFVARFHRQHRTAAVVSFVATLAAMAVYGWASSSVSTPPEDVRMLATWFSSAWARALFIAAPLAGVLIGGLGIDRAAERHLPRIAQA